MRLTLCHPSQTITFDGVKGRPMVGPPLGLMLIAGFLRASGWHGEVSIYDARLSAKRGRDAGGAEIFGDGDDEAAERIAAGRPDVVGISNMFTVQIGRAYALADAVKARLPGCTMVIGGPHVTVFPGEAIQRPSIDYVVMGEGEERMAALLRALESGGEIRVAGVVGKEALEPGWKKPRVDFIHDLDRLPLPAYDLVDMGAYFRLARDGLSPRHREWGKNPATVITSRGCPHTCSFCSIHITMGYAHRTHSVEYVANHVRHLAERHGVDFIHFEDDNLTHDPERFDAILAAMEAAGLRLRWDTPNGVRGDTWTYARILRAKASGCQFLTVAVESAVPRVLDGIVRKRLDLARVEEMIRWCDQAGLRLHAFYIIGFPGETVAEMRATVRFALLRYLRYGVTPFLQPLIPLPDTPIHKRIVKTGAHVEGMVVKANQVETAEFGPAQVRNLYRLYLWARLAIFAYRTFTCPRDFAYNLRLVARYRHAAGQALVNAFTGSTS